MNANPLDLMERSIGEALARQASDLFLIPGEPPLIRVSGAIERVEAPVVSREETAQIAEAALGPERLATLGPEVGEISTRNGLPEEANARMTVARSQGDVTLAVTFLHREIYTPEELAIPKALLQAVSMPSGLVVITGPTGSGMQTVAFSLIEYLNTRCACHICTAEDPVQVRFTPKKAMIQQREVGVDVPDGLAGIRAALRQDVDAIFINELRTVEELQACFTAAETGHIVIAVLHIAVTPDEAIHRLIDVFPEDIRPASRRSLARVLRCVSAQRLIPALKKLRVAAYGILVPDGEMRNAIAEGRDWHQRVAPIPKECTVLADDIRRLEREGIIAADAAKKALESLS